MLLTGQDDTDRAVKLTARGLGVLALHWRGEARRRVWPDPIRGLVWPVVRVLVRPRTLLIVGSAGLLAMLGMLFVHDVATGFWLLVFSPVSISLVLALMGAAGGGVLGLRRVRTALVVAMLEKGRCAGCGYSLAGLEDETERHIRCPECGAAWDRRRLFRSTDLEAEVVIVR